MLALRAADCSDEQVHVRHSRGSVHPVFAYGRPAVVLYTLAIVPFAGTAAWQAMTQALERLTS